MTAFHKRTLLCFVKGPSTEHPLEQHRTPWAGLAGTAGRFQADLAHHHQHTAVALGLTDSSTACFGAYNRCTYRHRRRNTKTTKI